MDIEDTITVTKLNIQGKRGYLMIGWQTNSFEMYLYFKENLWKGNFSANRLSGFSRTLQMTENDYFKNLKRCLGREHDDYIYELKSGFFYWKRQLKKSNSVAIEGFLPIELDLSDKRTQPDLIEVLIALNKQLREKSDIMQNKFKAIKSEYQKCLKDTEEFLDIKMEMEKTLCDKFITLLGLQKSRHDSLNAKMYGILKQ